MAGKNIGPRTHANAREYGMRDYDSMLSVALASFFAFAQAASAQTLPTVFVIGDSTASNTENRGWGDHLAPYFDTSRINVVNRARAGRSSRTFQTEGLWDKVLADMKPGDYVLIQFGHNDAGPPDKDRARGSLPGLGEESKEFTMPDGRTEVVHTFGWYMRKFISDTRAKSANPVVLSLTVRNIWKDGKVERGSGMFSQWSEQIARAEHVPFVDVTNAVADQYEKLGEEKVKELFSTDHTHTSPAGADINAATVAAELKRVNSPLALLTRPIL
jgi:rhamnogalacturonan acetylesterase